MAKRRSSAGTSRSANPPGLHRPSIVVVRRPTVMVRQVSYASPRDVLSDRRLYHPLRGYRPVAARSIDARRLVVPRKAVMSNPFAVAFRVPEKVKICNQRATRREVLFASGKGGRGYRKKTHNWWSSVSCRR